MTTKEEIINYVMNTPANTNEAVLRSLLDGYHAPSGGSEGYILITGTELAGTPNVGTCDISVDDFNAIFENNKIAAFVISGNTTADIATSYDSDLKEIIVNKTRIYSTNLTPIGVEESNITIKIEIDPVTEDPIVVYFEDTTYWSGYNSESSGKGNA